MADEINETTETTQQAPNLETQGLINTAILKAQANAIREKTGLSVGILPGDFAAALQAMPQGGKPEDVDFIEGDLVDLIDDQVLSITSKDALKGLEGALENVVLDSVSAIQESQFENFTALKTISMKSLQTMPRYVCYGCTSLYSVDFPGLKRLGYGAFYNAPIVGVVSLPNLETADSYNQQRSGAFQNTQITGFQAPKLKAIPAYMFSGCANLQSVDFTSVETIEANAFVNCTSLTEINAPVLKTITGGALEGCSNLVRVNAPSLQAVTKVTGFKSHPKLQKIYIPGCKSLATDAFYNCPQLFDVDFSGVETVGDTAVQNCPMLSDGALFPAAKTLGSKVFDGCPLLTDIELPSAETLNNTIRENTTVISFKAPLATSIGSGSFAFYATALASVILPNVLSVPYDAFRGCSHLNSVNLNRANSIGDRAFENCALLASISLPNAATLDYGVFYGCATLSAVDLPECVSVGYACFVGTALNGPLTLPKVQTIYASTSSGASYRGAFAETAISEIRLPECLTINAGRYYTNGAFYKCQSLASAYLPKCENVGDYAFSDCTALVTVNAPAVKSIGAYAFRNCTALTDIEIPASIESIAATAFNGCSALATIRIHKATDAISGAPWGATNAQIQWIGE